MMSEITRPRLLYVVTEDWYFLSHRLPMARAAHAAGFEVHVATRIDRGGPAIRAEGFHIHHVPFARGRISPGATVKVIRVLRHILESTRPVVCHNVALLPCLLASLAAFDRDTICINAITGLGFVFTSDSAKARVLRPVLRRMLRLVLDHRANISLVQNRDDHDALRALGVPASRIITIAGSGVDLAAFAPREEPAAPIKVGFAGRLLADKGIHTLVAAHALLRERSRSIEIVIAGAPDPANPSSVPAKLLDEWKRLPGLAFHGHVTDIARFWAGTHIAVLPSRREGLPKSLIEAAACGLPMIASDVPGCREVVVDRRTGLLVPVDDPRALADAIDALAGSAELRARYGREARALAEQRFGAELIAEQVTGLYRTALRQRNGRHAS